MLTTKQSQSLAFALLFARQRAGGTCTCHNPGYCAAHGEYNPGGSPEVRDVLDRDSKLPRVAKRVIRKHIEGSAS